MNPIEQIQQGIQKGDWNTVCKGFNSMTGQDIEPPHSVLDVIKEIHNITATALYQVDIIEEEPKKLPDKKDRPKHLSKQKKKRVTKSNKQIAMQTGIVDENGYDSSITLDDKNKTTVQKQTGGSRLITNTPDPEEIKRNAIQAKRGRANKLKLDRQANKKFKAKCSECEGTFDSDRPTGEMGQKCPKCLIDKQNRFN
jgi:hypothetical protein